MTTTIKKISDVEIEETVTIATLISKERLESLEKQLVNVIETSQTKLIDIRTKLNLLL